MSGTEAAQKLPSLRARRWSLAAAISSVTVFGLSIGQGAPLMSLLLEVRGTSVTLNGLNAGAAFIGVLVGPLLAPLGARVLGIRNLLLACFAVDMVLTLSLKLFDSVGAWFVLRVLLGLVGSGIFTASEAWINQLSSDRGRGRILGIYAVGLSVGFGIGPLVLTITGIHGWSPFVANAAITAVAMLPLIGVNDASRALGRERGASPLTMFARAPLILGTVAIFGLYEAALMALLPIWGLRMGLNARTAAATLSAVYVGAILLQVPIGWLSDKFSRVGTLRVCSAVGLIGALLVLIPATPFTIVLGLLFVWGGMASGVYPVALSMAGDRFRGSTLVSVNAAMIIAYGLGGLVGPALGGLAMTLWDPQGLFWLFALLFGALLTTAGLAMGRLRPRSEP